MLKTSTKELYVSKNKQKQTQNLPMSEKQNTATAGLRSLPLVATESIKNLARKEPILSPQAHSNFRIIIRLENACAREAAKANVVLSSKSGDVAARLNSY